MFKALLKKQILELFQSYIINRKTGKARSKGGIIGLIILFVGLLSLVSSGIFGLAVSIGDGIIPSDYPWLYFAIFGVLSILLGVFGSAFNTYASIYLSKDNDMLISMPIPPIKLLLSKIVSVLFLSLVYSGVVWVPSTIQYFFYCGFNPLKLIFPSLLLAVITLFVSTLTCFFGWLIAIIAKKIKGKSYVTVVLTLAFLAAYYYIYFNIQTILSKISENVSIIAGAFLKYLRFFYWIGKAGEGNFLFFLLLLAISVVAFSTCLLIMAKSFIKIATQKEETKKVTYDSSKTKSKSISKTLLSKELLRFSKSSGYMMNCGLSALMLPILGIFALVKSGDLLNAFLSIETTLLDIKNILPGGALAAVLFISGIASITAPSISLEGKSITILRSLPVNGIDVIRAKERLHMVIMVIPTVITCILLGIAIRTGIAEIVLITVASTIFNLLIADVGLFFNLLKPNFNWVNETIPVKQDLPVLFSILVGMGLSLICGVITIVLGIFVNAIIYLAVITLLLLGFRFLVWLWLKKKGTRIFERLTY